MYYKEIEYLFYSTFFSVLNMRKEGDFIKGRLKKRDFSKFDWKESTRFASYSQVLRTIDGNAKRFSLTERLNLSFLSLKVFGKRLWMDIKNLFSPEASGHRNATWKWMQICFYYFPIFEAAILLFVAGLMYKLVLCFALAYSLLYLLLDNNRNDFCIRTFKTVVKSYFAYFHWTGLLTLIALVKLRLSWPELFAW
ncbi:hypothetical protein HDE_13290 [Halotydeus destructor]|nr:hypothetical protein HDE_13290 [Halotydeus destructor]